MVKGNGLKEKEIEQIIISLKSNTTLASLGLGRDELIFFVDKLQIFTLTNREQSCGKRGRISM